MILSFVLKHDKRAHSTKHLSEHRAFISCIYRYIWRPPHVEDFSWCNGEPMWLHRVKPYRANNVSVYMQIKFGLLNTQLHSLCNWTFCLQRSLQLDDGWSQATSPARC